MRGAEAASRQRAQVVEIVEMQGRIQAAADHNGAHSREAADRVDRLAKEFDSGCDVLEFTTGVMQTTASTVLEGADLLREVVRSLAEIRQMVGAIQSIAFQTNMLALNAAIAAAHAGSDGAAFNVIAQEVQKLAQQTTDATGQIAERIGQMSAQARKAEAAMTHGTKAVSDAVTQSAALRSSFTEIRGSMHAVREISGVVAGASDAQSVASGQIADCVRQVDELASRATHDADVAAELNMRVVRCAAQLQQSLGKLTHAKDRALEQESAATHTFLLHLDEHEESLERARRLLADACTQAGPARLQGTMTVGGQTLPALYLGATAPAGTLVWLDRVLHATGCVATLFVRSNERFVRVATNVRGADGRPATGTELNPEGLACERLRNGETCHGTVYILGKPFLAWYDPLFSEAGELIGALYVGRAID